MPSSTYREVQDAHARMLSGDAQWDIEKRRNITLPSRKVFISIPRTIAQTSTQRRPCADRRATVLTDNIDWKRKPIFAAHSTGYDLPCRGKGRKSVSAFRPTSSLAPENDQRPPSAGEFPGCRYDGHLYPASVPSISSKYWC